MSVFLTNDELKTFADNGFDANAIKNTIGAYRNQGLSDDDIRQKINSKLAVFEFGEDKVAAARDAAKLAVQDARANRSTLEKVEDTAADITADFFGKNKIGRAAAATLQGVNKGNPIVQVASLIPGLETINDDIIQPENTVERALDLGSQFTAPAGITAKAMGAVGKAAPVANLLSKSRVGRFVAGALTPAAMPIEYASAFGAGAATGAIEPKSTLGKLATGVAGGLLGGGITGALSNRKAINAFFKNRNADKMDSKTRAVYKVLEKALAEGELDRAIDTAQERGVPLIDVGSENINQLARTARSISPHANEKISTRYDDLYLNAPSRVQSKLNEVFGLENATQQAERLAAELDPKANELYEMAFMGNTRLDSNTGKLYTARGKLPKDAFQSLDKNPYIRDAINKAPQIHKELQVLGTKGTEVPRNDLQRLDFTKEVLDGDIAAELTKDKPNHRLISSLTAAKKDLVQTMDNFSPKYKAARAVSGQKLSALEAQKLGAKIDRSDITTDEFVKRVADMTPAEVEALRVGIRDFYKNGFENAQNKAVFANRLLDEAAQIKLRAALPKDDADALINFAQTLVNQNNARNLIMRGSRTAENQAGISDAIGAAEEIVGNPIKGSARKVGRAFDTARARALYGNVADLLLANPQTLRAPMKSIRPKLSDVLKAQSGTSVPVNSIVSPILQQILGAQ